MKHSHFTLQTILAYFAGKSRNIKFNKSVNEDMYIWLRSNKTSFNTPKTAFTVSILSQKVSYLGVTTDENLKLESTF